MCATPRYVVGLVRGGLLVWNHAGGESRGIACDSSDSSQLLGVYIVSDAFVFVWDANKHFLFNLETGNVAAVEFPASQIHVPYRVASYLCATVLVLTKNNPTNPTDILRVYDAETGSRLEEIPVPSVEYVVVNRGSCLLLGNSEVHTRDYEIRQFLICVELAREESHASSWRTACRCGASGLIFRLLRSFVCEAPLCTQLTRTR
jgi:hypothetical protein